MSAVIASKAFFVVRFFSLCILEINLFCYNWIFGVQKGWVSTLVNTPDIEILVDLKLAYDVVNLLQTFYIVVGLLSWGQYAILLHMYSLVLGFNATVVHDKLFVSSHK